MALRSVHNVDIIPNLDIISYYDENNNIQLYEIYPLDSYALRISALDNYQTDDNGQMLFNETRDKVFIKPYYSSGGGVVPGNYNWEENPDGYSAVLYRDDLYSEVLEVDVSQELSKDYFIEMLELSEVDVTYLQKNQ